MTSPTEPDPAPTRPPTAGGLLLRVLVWPLYVALGAAVLIPLWNLQPFVAIAVALLFGGIARALVGVRNWWLQILAIPVALGMAAGLLLASPMLTIVAGERVPFTVGEFSHGLRCTVHEVDGDRVHENVSCQTDNQRWEEGSVVELAVGGPLPHTYDDGSPWEADKLERTFGWVLPVAVASFVIGLALRILKVWQGWYRPSRE
ncbi:hypothetical protein [Pseudactinotalea sp.]|uniref:hypothetical protein n=1 Tax=Pseudactinotalea sp. TaxID=1926260 RepID=UPI003B3A8EED